MGAWTWADMLDNLDMTEIIRWHDQWRRRIKKQLRWCHMFDVKGFYQQYISWGVTMIRIKMVIRTPELFVNASANIFCVKFAKFAFCCSVSTHPWPWRCVWGGWCWGLRRCRCTARCPPPPPAGTPACYPASPAPACTWIFLFRLLNILLQSLNIFKSYS